MFLRIKSAVELEWQDYILVYVCNFSSKHILRAAKIVALGKNCEKSCGISYIVNTVSTLSMAQA